MKYRLRNLNCVQETDSEERRDELLKKGYKLEDAPSKKQGQRGRGEKNADTDKQESPSGQVKTDEKKG